MSVDKNLFAYELAVVAILKNEGPYLKEWLNYHLLAGVDHFYLYDNDSLDNQAEVAAPYIESGLVDYFYTPGKAAQMFTHIDAVKRFKFFTRYIAIIDGDEFIFPKTNQSIVEVVDEILSRDPNAAGLSANLHTFGSNGQETADYSRGVLERFTRRASSTDKHVSTISNPRRINFFFTPHKPIYFEGVHSVNENGGIVVGYFNEPATAEKIVMNHYHTKSREEYAKKVQRGNADHVDNRYSMKNFDIHNRNEEFDDGILRYRAARADKFFLESHDAKINRVTNALIKNLSAKNFSLETALTCRETFRRGVVGCNFKIPRWHEFIRCTTFTERVAKSFAFAVFCRQRIARNGNANHFSDDVLNAPQQSVGKFYRAGLYSAAFTDYRI